MCSLGLGLSAPGPRPRGQWSVDDLVRAGAELDVAYGLTGSVVEAGLAEAAGRAYQFTEAGVRAAQRTLDEGRIPTAVDGGASWKRQVWQAARMARRFTIPDLMRSLAGVDVPYDRVYRFVRRLETAGALARVTRGRRGTHQPWRVARDGGPTPPCN